MIKAYTNKKWRCECLRQCGIDFIHLHIAITTFTDYWLPVSNDLLTRLIGSLSPLSSAWERCRLVTQKPLPPQVGHMTQTQTPTRSWSCNAIPPPPQKKILMQVMGNRMTLKQHSYESITLSKVQVMTPYTIRDNAVTP